MTITLTAILIAYFIGAIPFGLLVARIFGVRDIRKVGSGNIGATNVLRTLGVKAAVWVYLLDIGKGSVVVWVAGIVFHDTARPELMVVMIGIAAILGHIFPVYLRFRGGKGVATAAGVLAVLLPSETLVAVVVFLVIVFSTRYVSVASMAAALALPLTVVVEQNLYDQEVSQVYWLLTVAIGLFVPLTHVRNIRRLLAGTENRFSLGRHRGNDE
ncbi:MAG: glycerol-3-phosphate 1-O-acyltransferase PlsY [candidate division Zixibacteria bacterium]|nr:glycerol-3-phosphate 1-O-acyltransferase PlsY [candidate division Zixibacteria bacterium]